jgi:DNA-binding CsgD family transcriptional regulator
MAIDVGEARAGRRTEGDRWPLVGRSREIALLRGAIEEHQGAVITGPAGVGKTALAAVGVEFAREQGMAVAAVAGTESSRPFAFGAFASLLPRGLKPGAAGPEFHAELLRQYTRELLDEACGRPLLVFVDDAHLLDDGSAMLVHQLSQTGSATILTCVRASGRTLGPAPDPMVVLWKDHSARRIELGPLGEAAVVDLLLTVLGGPVDTATGRLIVERTLGDPLFLRELVDGARESGRLVDDGGVWRLRGPLQPTPRLVDLVTVRLGPVSEAERHVLELIALAEPLAQSTLDQLADPDAIASLEDRGAIASRKDGRRLQVSLAHPVFGDVVRLGISARRERTLARALADASGGRRREDTLHLASLRLVGGGGSPELLLAGAQAARDQRDFELTERMARAAIDSGAGFEARLLAAEAAHARGRSRQAEEELAALALVATAVSEQVRVALLRFDHAFFSTGRADAGAIDHLLGVAGDPVWHDELLARRLLLEGLVRGPQAVLADAGPVPTRSPGEPRSSLQAVVGDALTHVGRLEEALPLLAPALTILAPSAPPTGATPGATHAERAGGSAVRPPVRAELWSPVGSYDQVLIGLGRLHEVDDLLVAAQGEAALHPGSIESAVVAANLATLRLEQGRVQSAFRQATSAAAIFMDLGLPVSARRCYAVTALALAFAGVADKAAETLAELDTLGLPTDMEHEVEVLQARAWAWASAGDMATARKNLEVAVDLGHEVGDHLGITRALHGLARMGRARQVAAQLGELADHVQGEFTQARLAYALAAAARDSHLLEEVAGRFEAIGALLYAAEALGEAAVHSRREGQTREAAAAQQKAARLLAHCEGAVTPFVRAIGARAQLTPAELDTALQAATGSTDKQIAELMNLSVRTVENRLHRAYQKLGVSHRRELTEALRDLPST